MGKALNNVIPLRGRAAAQFPCMGWFAGFDAQGRPLVRLATASADAPALPARCLAGFGNGTPPGAALLLLRPAGDEMPVILGLVTDTVPAAASTLLDALLPPSRAASLDGRRLVLEASQEVVLRCGKGSITLEASGRVVIKGTELVSRSLGANKIRGATVSIN